jgi:hypothetical protein
MGSVGKKINTKRYKIKEISLMSGDLPVVKRNNDYAYILMLKNQINDLIENYFHGEVSYVYDSHENLLKHVGDSKKLLDHWVKRYEELFDKIPNAKKTPYTTKDLTDALDHGI